MHLYNDAKDNQSIQEWLQKILLHYKDNEESLDQFYTIKDAFIKVEVPRHFWGTIFRIIKQEKYMDIAQSIKEFPPVRLREEGLLYLNEREEEYFQTHLKLFSNMADFSLEETMELIFQKHKQNGNRVVWTKETFRPNVPSNLDVAAATLESKGIIDYTSRRRPIISILHHDVMDCDNYFEANRKLTEAKNKPQGHSVNTGAGSMVILGNSHMRDFDFHPTINPPTTPTIADAKQGKIKAVINWILQHIVLVLILGVIVGLIVAYFTNAFGWND